jgi:cobalt-zinc-cadmium efflux system outer membrane protein
VWRDRARTRHRVGSAAKKYCHATPRFRFGVVNFVMRFLTRAAAPCILLSAAVARGQQPITRQQAVDAAVARAPRTAIARADTLVGSAQLASARQRDNPSLSASYSKSTPHYHAVADLPLDITGARGARIRSAQAAQLAARYRFDFERAGAALDADTSYTRAIAARDRMRLARRNAADADSLRRMTIVRRDAGDASELDVLLATVNTGQAANLEAADSLTFVSTLFDLQGAMAIDTNLVFVVPIDSLTLPPVFDSVSVAGQTLPVAAAMQSLAAAELGVTAQRRSVLAPFSLQAGVEQGDPSENGLLPTFGISIPLPLLNRNAGAIALAEAERERARAELTLTQIETRAAVGRALRQQNVSLAKIRRDRLLVESANRVAAMSLTAYREGAQGLPAVLEAQRNAREVLAQYIDDLADAWIATATLRLYSLPVPR